MSHRTSCLHRLYLAQVNTWEKKKLVDSSEDLSIFILNSYVFFFLHFLA